MSKMDGLRAMREARYEQAAARARQGANAPRPTAPATAVRAERPAAEAPTTSTEADSLCGHRAISGRTCTRERGHAAKSHRYS